MLFYRYEYDYAYYHYKYLILFFVLSLSDVWQRYMLSSCLIGQVGLWTPWLSSQ